MEKERWGEMASSLLRADCMDCYSIVDQLRNGALVDATGLALGLGQDGVAQASTVFVALPFALERLVRLQGAADASSNTSMI